MSNFTKKFFRFYRKHMLEKMFDKYNKHKKHGPNQDQKSKVENLSLS